MFKTGYWFRSRKQRRLFQEKYDPYDLEILFKVVDTSLSSLSVSNKYLCKFVWNPSGGSQVRVQTKSYTDSNTENNYRVV